MSKARVLANMVIVGNRKREEAEAMAARYHVEWALLEAALKEKGYFYGEEGWLIPWKGEKN